MNTNDKIDELLTRSLAQLKETGIDQGEILYWETEMGSLRTFLNRLSHNGLTHDAEMYVSSIRANRRGHVQTSDLSKTGIERAVRNATDQAMHSTPLKFSFVFPGPYHTYSLKKKAFYDSSLQIAPIEKINMLRKITETSNENGLSCSAKLMSGGGKIGVINTSGTMMIMEFTEASLSLILTGKHAISSYSSGSSENIKSLDVDQIMHEAIVNAHRQKLPWIDSRRFRSEEIYFDLILEPYAVAEWVETLGSIGLNGLHFEEGESFISGKLNQKLLGDNITLYDDATDMRGFIAPFDFEGVPKKRQLLFERGIAKSVCYDVQLAQKYGRSSTGHGLPPFERSYGAIPRHLIMEGGENSIEEMVSSSQEPTLYITRFHYTNVVDPKKAILTGMTKDGTFLIENGKFVGPISNLRYLESIPEALSRVTHLGEPRIVHDPTGYGGLYPESTVVPPLKIKNVKFIGTSQNLRHLE